jgi:hypothetical protein
VTLRLLALRGRVQLPLLSAVVAMVTIGATLLGVCVLLLTVSQDQALTQGLARARADDVSVTAYVTDVPGPQTASVAADTRTTMASALAPLPISSTDLRASSVVRPLDDDRDGLKVAYLSAIDGLQDRTRLTSGRLPRPAASGRTGVFEAAVLESTAARLGVRLGERVPLSAENSPSDPGPALTLELVGIVQPLDGAGWDRDPLRGAGYDPAYRSAQYAQTTPAFGPFIVDPADLWAGGATVDSLQVTVRPDLSNATGPDLDAATGSLAGVDPRLKVGLGQRIGNERVVSSLLATLSAARLQQDVTRSTVLVVVLLGTTLTAAALGLAARLMLALRAGETALFSAMGAGPGQLAAQAAIEALSLAVLSSVLAVPLSSLAHAGLTHLPRLAGAGLAGPPAVTGTQVATVLAGALLLATVLVIPALRPDPAQISSARGRLGLLTRSGGDLLLLVLAAAGWWQLHSQPAGASGTDAVRVAAPVLCLLAGAAVAPRVLAVPLRFAERRTRTSLGLVLPLAVLEAARRPRTVAAGLLLALAAAAGTFGLAFGSTWERSQQDQAAARVGTDLALSLAGPMQAGQVAALAGATGGSVSSVTDRSVILGRYLGGDDHLPRLLAVDTRQAGVLLRGRLPAGQTWKELGVKLTPGEPVAGAVLAGTGNAPATLTGAVEGVDGLQLALRLVVQDRLGSRTTCTLPTAPLDGRPHQLRLCGSPAPGSQVVALHLAVQAGPTLTDEQVGALTLVGKGQLALDLSLPAAADAPAAAADWTSSSLSRGSLTPIPSSRTTATRSGEATVLHTEALLDLQADLEAMEVVITSFEKASAIPALVSQRVADEVQAEVGGLINVVVGVAAVPVVVTTIVPSVPAAPGEVALLVDADSLSRSMIQRGDLDPPVDAVWVGDPDHAGAAARAEALGLGSVVTRAGITQELTSGPLRVGLPAALLVLVPAVILLVLAGIVLHVTSDVDARAMEIARLRGLGLSRRDILTGLLVQHGGVLALLLGWGAAVGLLTSFAVAPLLVRSDVGAAPVPVALASWPWSSETALLAVLLLGSIAAMALVVRIQLRRADTAYLRVGA